MNVEEHAILLTVEKHAILMNVEKHAILLTIDLAVNTPHLRYSSIGSGDLTVPNLLKTASKKNLPLSRAKHRIEGAKVILYNQICALKIACYF